MTCRHGGKFEECEVCNFVPRTPIRMCAHCGGDLEIRNPTGRCDHLHYPDNCKVCKKTAQVTLHKDPFVNLLNRWKQRRAVHERLAKGGDTKEWGNTPNGVIASTLGFCIREIEDLQKKLREES